MMKKSIPAGGVFLVVVLVPVFATWVFAGDLEPSAGPAPTMHSLEEIYNLIANIGTAPVEKTGQTPSYATGDDGDREEGLAWPDSRFADNDDGTVTDNLTGLTWLKNADRFGEREWVLALTDCNSLVDDGTELTDGSLPGDWRLPNIKELQSLIDYGNSGPALPANHPFTNVRFGNYWSSTTVTGYTSMAWNINIFAGDTNYPDKTANYYVWPVRGGN
jgi:hypothetical protein